MINLSYVIKRLAQKDQEILNLRQQVGQLTVDLAAEKSAYRDLEMELELAQDQIEELTLENDNLICELESYDEY